jgi:hypothetical protein
MCLRITSAHLNTLRIFSFMAVSLPLASSYCVCCQGRFRTCIHKKRVLSGSILLLTCALAAICAVGGMFLGKAMLKKHFAKAGAV